MIRTRMKSITGAALAALSLAACATAEVEIPQGVLALGDPARPVVAAVETVVTTDAAVDADDPAFHALDGTVRQFFPDGPMNNVDVRDGFVVDGKPMVLIAAAERDRFGVMTWLMDPDTLEVRRWGFISTSMGEPYGFCMGRRGDAFYVVTERPRRRGRAPVEAGHPDRGLRRR